MHSLLPLSIAFVAGVGALVTLVAAGSDLDFLPNRGKPLYFLSGGFALTMLFFVGLGIKMLRSDIARGLNFDSPFPNDKQRAQYVKSETKRFALYALGNGLVYAAVGGIVFVTNEHDADARVALLVAIALIVTAAVASLVSLNKSAATFAHALIRYVLISIVALLVTFTLLILLLFLSSLFGLLPVD